MKFAEDKFANAAITWIIIALASPVIVLVLMGWI